MCREDKIYIGLSRKDWEGIAQFLHGWQAPFREGDELPSMHRRKAVEFGNLIAEEITRGAKRPEPERQPAGEARDP